MVETYLVLRQEVGSILHRKNLHIFKSWRSQHTIHIYCIKFEVTVNVIIVHYKIMNVDQVFI